VFPSAVKAYYSQFIGYTLSGKRHKSEIFSDQREPFLVFVSHPITVIASSPDERCFAYRSAQLILPGSKA
jgi:hypothetical protein